MDDSDSGRAVEIKLRWPPFEPNTVRASELPVADRQSECQAEAEGFAERQQQLSEIRLSMFGTVGPGSCGLAELYRSKH